MHISVTLRKAFQGCLMEKLLLKETPLQRFPGFYTEHVLIIKAFMTCNRCPRALHADIDQVSITSDTFRTLPEHRPMRAVSIPHDNTINLGINKKEQELMAYSATLPFNKESRTFSAGVLPSQCMSVGLVSPCHKPWSLLKMYLNKTLPVRDVTESGWTDTVLNADTDIIGGTLCYEILAERLTGCLLKPRFVHHDWRKKTKTRRW